MSTRRAAPDPRQPAATDVGALGALPPVLDPRSLGEIAGGLTVPMAMPFSLYGAEGEAKAMHPPVAGSDPRGLPPQALAVAIGSVPGGTGAPGYYFLPLPSGGSPFLPGDASAGKIPTPPPTPAVPAPGGGMDPSAGAVPPPAAPPSTGVPEVPLSRPPSDGPAAAPAAAGATAPPTMGFASPSGAAFPLPAMPDGKDASGASPAAQGAVPGMPAMSGMPAMPATGSMPEGAREAPAMPGMPGTPGMPGMPGMPAMPGPDAPPASAEDEAALKVALDLAGRLGEAFSTPEHAALGQMERPDASPHLPTSDAQIRDLLRAAMGPALPDLHGSSSVPGATMPEATMPGAEDLYFLGTVPAVPAVPAAGASSTPAFDANAVRRDFPALHQDIGGHPLVWLDNAATTHKPEAVIDAVSRFYEKDNSNIHRGAHTLAARATEAYENARDTVRRFLGASESEEIVFARGTTEAINLVMNAWGRKYIRGGDEIVLTLLEHHANIVPWQMLRQMTGCVLKVVPVTDRGEVDMEAYTRLLGPRTRLVAATQVSNALGTVVPVKQMATLAHRHGAMMLVDGAQSVPHLKVDVQDLGADFFVFSGHKIFAPMGIGALYARKALLEDMEPWQGGGSMIVDVTFDRTIYSQPPAKFEAGTPSVGDAVGLAAALDYVERIGLENMARYEDELLHYGTERLKEVPGLRLIGTAPDKVSVMSFLIDGTRPEDIGRYLNTRGIAVRAGHHCAQPTVRRFGTEGTVRPSLAVYNNKEDVDRLVEALLDFRSSPEGAAGA